MYVVFQLTKNLEFVGRECVLMCYVWQDCESPSTAWRRQHHINSL